MTELTDLDTMMPPPENTVSPALEKRAIQNEGGFLTPYYLFDLMERRHAEELDPLGREAYRIPLKHVFLQAQKKITGLAGSGTPISLKQTWTLWYKELFQMLGFSPLQPLTEPVETARYGLVPISHAYYLDEHTDEDPLIFIDLHPFGTDLDHARYPNPEGNRELITEPISRALEFALDHHQTRWALLSNGLEMRLYRRGGSVARQYLKVDFVTLFAQEDAKDWLVFWGLFRLAAFLPSSIDEPTESGGAPRCLLDKVIDESQRHATKIADDLRDNIVRAVENLLQGVIESPENYRFWHGEFNSKKVPDETQLKALFEESVYFLYRLLFVLYAESRDLLPVGESEIYKEVYSLDHLRYMAEKMLRPEDYEKTYYIETLRTLFKMLYHGYPFRNPAASTDKGPSRAKGSAAFRIPPYNGRLFDPKRTALLNKCHIPDRAMREVIRELSLSHPKRRGDRPERYSYADLGVDQLGSIYEGLLVYEPAIAEQTMVEARLKGEIRLIPQDQADELDLPYDEATRKPAGSFHLRIWGGRRKGSGSYYTPQEITAFLVKDALAPLVEPIIAGCAQRDEEGKPVRHADEILHIKVCDPAMGSGHFLVQACRYLGDAYGRAIIAEEQREHTRLSASELAKYKRRVAERCLYGVDLNPLAVELAKVSLWLETLAQDRPLTFLDAHLRCGNALIGAPLRNQEGNFDTSIVGILPVEAYKKVDRVDSKTYGQKLDKLKIENGKQLKQFIGKAKQLSLFALEEERDALVEYEQLRSQLEESDEDKTLEDAVELVHRKDALLQSALLGNESKIRAFKQLCDLWCAIWFWPVDAELLPPSTVLYRELAALILKRPVDFIQENADAYLEFASKIAHEQRFFHWELEFPEVWCDEQGNFKPDGGFDVIVGNPPWSKLAPNSKEFWANYIPIFPALPKQEAERTAEEIRSKNGKADTQWKAYMKALRQRGELFKQGELFSWQGKGNFNTYKLFMERMFKLTKINGICSLVLPASLYTDEGCTDLREKLLLQQGARFIIAIENRGGVFPAIDSRQKFVLLSEQRQAIQKAHENGNENSSYTQAIRCLFLVGKDDAWQDRGPSPEGLGMLLPQLDRYLLDLPSHMIKVFAPDTYGLLEFKSQRELDLAVKIYTSFPPLGKQLENSWNVSFVTEIHMTGGSHFFRDAARLKLFGATEQPGRVWKTPPEEWYQEQPEIYELAERVVTNNKVYFPTEVEIDKVRYTHSGYLLKKEVHTRQALPIVPGETYVPLYEGRMVHQFDHAAKAYMQGSGRSAEWRALSFDQKEIIPHYFVAQHDWLHIGFRAGFCDVTGPTNERTMLAAMIPSTFPCGNTVSVVNVQPDTSSLHLLLVTLMNSFVFDWLLRFRVTNHTNFFLLEPLAVPRPKIESDEAQLLIQAATRLTCVTPEFAPLWSEIMGTSWQATDGARDMHERARLRAQIDAIVADLYGLTEHDFAYILNTFPLLDRDQPPLPDEGRSFITRDLALLALFQRRGKTPPADIVSFFAEAGVDIRQRTGTITDLAKRVYVAIQEQGAIAYQPTQREKEENGGDEEILEQEELDFYDEE
jgi:hypothetical protein